MSLKQIVTLALLAALLPSWLGLAGRWHWLLDLFAHFRWQYLVIAVAASAWALWSGHRGLAVLGVATLLLNAVLIGRLALQPDVSRAALADDFTLRVLAVNVRTSNPDKQAVLEHVRASGADLVFVMEVDDAWLAALERLQAEYPHRIARPRPDNFGLALLSRLPFGAATLLELGQAPVPSVSVSLEHQGRQLTVIGTHPLPPIGSRMAAARNAQLAALDAHVTRVPGPVLVVGDLNATPWSAGIRLATRSRLAWRSLQPPWVPTWRARSPFAIPIDHALCTAPLVITRRHVGPDVGSDHRPVLFDVAFSR